MLAKKNMTQKYLTAETAKYPVVLKGRISNIRKTNEFAVMQLYIPYGKGKHNSPSIFFFGESMNLISACKKGDYAEVLACINVYLKMDNPVHPLYAQSLVGQAVTTCEKENAVQPLYKNAVEIEGLVDFIKKKDKYVQLFIKPTDEDGIGKRIKVTTYNTNMKVLSSLNSGDKVLVCGRVQSFVRSVNKKTKKSDSIVVDRISKLDTVNE